MSAMMNAKSRAYKVIGMRVVDLVNSLFPSGAQASQHSKNGKIVRGEFFILWSMIASPDEATEFLDAILAQLINYLDSKTPPNHGVSLDTLVNTIAFIIIFLPFKTNSRLIKDFLDSWNSKTNDPARDPSRDHQSVRTVVRLLSLRVGSHDKDSAEDILGPLIIGASTLHNAADFARLSSVIRCSTVDESEIRPNEFGFVYSYLMQLVSARVKNDSPSHDVSYQQIVLSFLVSKTLTLSQQMKMNPQVAQSTLLALLHMIIQIIRVDSVTSCDFLCKAISTLQPYFLWPEPLGSIVHSAISTLQAELLSPGCNRRASILQDSRSVDYVSTAGRPTGYKYAKPIFYFYDSDDLSALPALNVLDAVPYDSEKLVKPVPANYEVAEDGTVLPPIAIQAQLILYTVNTEATAVATGLTGAQTQGAFLPLTPSTINALTANQIAHFYSKIREVDALSINSPASFDETREDRSMTLFSIRGELEQTAKSNGGGSQSYFDATAESPYNPINAPVEHVRVPVNIRASAHSSSASAAANYGSSSGMGGAMGMGMGLGMGMAHSVSDNNARRNLTYPASAMYDRLHEIFQVYSYDANKSFPRDINIVIAGDDVLLHHISTAYYLLRKLNSELLASLNVKFFLIPFSRNHMAGYLARHDSWYLRHIFTPFRSNALLVPWIGLSAEDSTLSKQNNLDNSAPVPPTVFLRDCATQYVRQTSCSLDAVIYQIEGFEDEKSFINQQPTDVIPFLQRVEFGHAVTVEEHCSRNPKLRPEDVARDKAFVSSPLELNVKFTLVDLSGARQPEVVEDSASYTNILLSSVPRKNDLCYPADPASMALELFASASRADRSKLKKNLLISEPRQHVAEVSVGSANGAKFRVLIDGTIYGPFHHVKISPASLPGEPVAKFNIKTFFPISH